MSKHICGSSAVGLRGHHIDQNDRALLWFYEGWACGTCGVYVAREDLDELEVDHDHTCCSGVGFRSCGQCIRGFLHPSCNTRLGAHENGRGELTLGEIAYLVHYAERGPYHRLDQRTKDEKIGDANRGKIRTDESRARMSKAHKGSPRVALAKGAA
jgi:hypothetical protein